MQGPKKVYVDGSFLNNEVRWAYLVYEQDDTLIQSAAGVLKSNEEVLSGRQVAGELEAVIQAVKWLSLIHISEPTRPVCSSRMPSSA